MEEHRRCTRANLKNSISAELDFPDLTHTESRRRVHITGLAKDIGTTGMFFSTEQWVPMEVSIDVRVFFDPDKTVLFHARGQVVRRTECGIGIKFLNINLDEFNSCVMYMLSH